MLVHQFLEVNAERFPYKDAAIHLGGRINYFQLEAAANRLANNLIENGIQPGDRVGIIIEPSINYIIAYFAILKAGAIVVGLNTQNTLRSCRNVLSDCEVSCLIISNKQAHYVKDLYPEISSLNLIICDGAYDRFPANIRPRYWLDIQLNGNPSRPDVSRNYEDYAQIIYTSGTTGSPKGVVLSHKNLHANTISIVKYICLNPDDRVMSILPFYYS